MSYGHKNYGEYINNNRNIGEVYGENISKHRACVDGSRYPTSVLKFNNVRKGLHPTQKPIGLLEYLIKTYSNEGDIVLDNCMGVGSTGIACMNTGRKFIGFEKDENYYKLAEYRILQNK